MGCVTGQEDWSGAILRRDFRVTTEARRILHTDKNGGWDVGTQGRGGISYEIRVR
jgi:hypothetical protein